MFSGASVAVTAGTDLVVEGTWEKGRGMDVNDGESGDRGGIENLQLTLSCSVPKMEAR